MNKILKYYEILGLQPGASQADVKQAYRDLAKTCHPDCFPDAQLKQQVEEGIKKINEAYDYLKFYQPSFPNQTSRPEVNPTNSANAESCYNQAMKNAESGRYTEAIEGFSRAIRLNPDYINAYKFRGLACSKLGYENRAYSDLKKVAELELKQRETEPSPAQPAPPPPAPPSRPQPQPAPPKSTSPWNCIHTLTGHASGVSCIAISPDGQTLASGSSDKTIKIWHLSTGKLLHTFTGHYNSVLSVVFSPDGKTLASSGGDHSIRLWQRYTGKQLYILNSHSDGVNAVAFSPDGQMIALC